MKLNPNTAAGVKQVLKKLAVHVTADREDIAATLRSVSTGEMELVEILSPDEEEYARKLFGWVAAAQHDKLAGALESVIAKAVNQDGDTPLHTVAVPTDEHALLEGLLREASAAGVPLPPQADMNKHFLTRIGILLLSYIFYEDFHFPQTGTGVYNIARDMFEKVKWAYRYWFNQLEVAAQQSGLEEFFAGQDLHFAPGRGVERRVSISCAGDLLAVDVLVPENTPNLFDGIADFYSTADIVSANLESTVDKDSPIGRHQAPGEPARMNTSEGMFRRFVEDGKINFFSSATNHSLDWDEKGVLATLDVLQKSGARFSGTAASQEEQDDVVVVEKNGIKLGFLTYTFDLNGFQLPPDKPYLVNEVRFNDINPGPDLALVKRQVAAAKAKGAEYIIAWCHWGWEFELYPHPNVVKVANEIIDAGVDTILGNHPHVSQPMQRVKREGRPDGLIVYAFGDFVSYHPESRNSKLAYSVKFDIVQHKSDDGPVTSLANLKMLPMYIVNAPREDGSYDCRIVKFDDVLDNSDRYGLTELEKSQLTHLNDRVLHGILVPQGGNHIIAK